MEGPVPRIIILALGAGALGGHDALHLLLQLRGRSPLIDLAISVFVVGMVTGYGMGNVLLARFVMARARWAAPPGADHLAQMTLVVSAGVGLLVTACLLVVSLAERGGFATLRRLVGSAAKRRPSTALFFVIAAAAAAAAVVLLYTTRVFLKAGTASSPAHAASSKMARTVRLTGPPLVAVVLLAVLFAAPNGLDSARLFPGSTDMLATVAATAVVAGAVLLAGFLRMVSNAAGTSGRDAAPTHAADTRRFTKVTSLGVGFILVWLLGATFAEMVDPKYTCSARCPPPVPAPPTCM